MCGNAYDMNPSIAQLVERWTVVGHFKWQTSIGRWFESGSKEFFLPAAKPTGLVDVNVLSSFFFLLS